MSLDTESTPSVQEMLAELLAEQKQHREEVAALRADLDKQKRPVPQTTAVALSPEEALAVRMEEIAAHDFYCTGCGLLHDFMRECVGRPEAPHPPIVVTSTDELKRENPAEHTAAPNTGT